MIEEQLRGCRQEKSYELITDSRSQPLKLRLVVDGGLISFHREDTGEKVLVPEDLLEALQEEVKARQQAEERAEQAEELLARYRECFGELPE